MNTFFKSLSINLVLLLSLSVVSQTHCMLDNTKDTDSILHDNYKYLSLVDGAIAWETGVIRRLYDLGQIFPVYGQDKKGRNIIENYEHPEQTHKIVRLIHALFYRVPGSTGETDFGVTTQLATDNPVEVVTLIAQMIAQCEQLRQQRSQFEKALDYVQGFIGVITYAGWLGKLGRKVTRMNLEQKIAKVRAMPWDDNAATAFVSMCKSFTKNLAKEFDENIVQQLELQQQTAQKYFKTIVDVTKNLRALLKKEVFKKRESVESIIVQALNESDPQNPDALYPLRTVEMILLAFVYKKYSNDRNVLKAFYDALNTQFGEKVLLHELDELWVKDSFAPVTQPEALKTIETIFASKDLMHSINQHFAEFVYNAFQIRGFPAPIGYENATYEYEKGKKTVGFSDCMCNTMRNFINLYAYDAEQNKFTLKKLLTTMGITVAHPVLAQFLKDFDSVNMASSPQAHNAWLQVISNIPYVAYNQMVDGSTEQSTKALDMSKGYVTVPDNEQTDELLDWLKNNGYQALEKNQYGYELQPSVKNIIIVLDHLLQLNLFVNAGGLAKEFMRPDFIKEYFPKLCEAVKATGFLSTQEEMEQGELNKDFDALDYTFSYKYMRFNLAKITCELAVSFGHGDLKLIKVERAQKEERVLTSLLEKINDFSGQLSLSLVTTNLFCRQEINFYHLKNNLKYLYINLFTAPLENTGLLGTIINQSFFITKDKIVLKIKIELKNLLFCVAERQPDKVERQKNKMDILANFIENLSEDEVINDSMSLTNLFKEAIELAKEGIFDQTGYLEDSALELFKTLFIKGQAVSAAIEIAQNGIDNDNEQVKGAALNLFILLVKNNQAFAEATQVAAKEIVNQSKMVSDFALKLFQVLIKKDQAFDEAIQIAIEGFRNQISPARILSAITLFLYLLPKYENETKKAIQNILDDPDFKLTEFQKNNLNDLLQQ